MMRRARTVVKRPRISELVGMLKTPKPFKPVDKIRKEAYEKTAQRELKDGEEEPSPVSHSVTKEKELKFMPQEPQIIRFPQGIPGFETHHDFRFVLEEDPLFAYLGSVQEERVGFILVRPEAFFPEYAREIGRIHFNEEDIELLNIRGEQTLDVWLIMTLHRQDLARTTVNLRAPLLLNIVKGIGIQVILEDDRYSSRQPLQPLLAEDNPQPLQEGVAG